LLYEATLLIVRLYGIVDRWKNKYETLIERYRQKKIEEYIRSALLIRREVSKRKYIYFIILCLRNFKIRNDRRYSNFGYFSANVFGTSNWTITFKINLTVRHWLSIAVSIRMTSFGWNEINPRAYTVADVRTVVSRYNSNKVEGAAACLLDFNSLCDITAFGIVSCINWAVCKGLLFG
jgi:hypothetical protein